MEDQSVFAMLSAGYYAFVLNMWLMCRIAEAQINTLVTNGKLTREEADAILATPRNCP
jgi:hypothetical protein